MKHIKGELARFLMVGVGSNILNFLVYVLAHSVGTPLVVASAVGYLAGILNSYYFGKIWVFDASAQAGRSAIVLFLVVYAIGGMGMSGIIEALDRYVGLDYRISWFFGASFAFVNNFLGSKWLVFKGSEMHDGD